MKGSGEKVFNILTIFARLFCYVAKLVYMKGDGFRRRCVSGCNQPCNCTNYRVSWLKIKKDPVPKILYECAAFTHILREYISVQA